MRRPAAVLIDREPDAVRFGERHQPLAVVEVGHEGLLRQHVLAGAERGLDDRQARLGMRRHVDDVDLRVGQHLLPAVGDARLGRVAGGLLLRLRSGAVADRGHLPAGGGIGVEVAGGDPAGADQPDPRAPAARRGRTVWKLGRRHLRHRRAAQRVGVGVGLAHGSSSSVRFSRADCAAVSTIRCPSGERGVERPLDRPAGGDAPEHVLDAVALPFGQRLGLDRRRLGAGAGLDGT